MKELISSASSNVAAPNKISCFGPPPLIDGEDAKAYDDLLVQVSSTVKPSDFLEEMWVRDVVDLTWEIFRWRRLKAQLFSSRLLDLVKSKMGRIFKTDKELNELMALWMEQEPGAIDLVQKYLAATGDTLEGMAAGVILNSVGYFRRLEEFTTNAERRRNATLREVDRHRAVLAQRLRDKVQEIEGATFKAIEHKALPQTNSTTKNAA